MERFRFRSARLDFSTSNGQTSDDRTPLWKKLFSSLRKFMNKLRYETTRVPPSSSPENDNSGNTRRPLRENRRRSRNRTDNGRQFLKQACCYVVAYILTLVPSFLGMIMVGAGHSPSFGHVVFAHILFPLQGLFNVLIYTRPHVNKEQRKNPNIGWCKAFLAVVASGGDDDEERTNRLRRAHPNSLTQQNAAATTSPESNRDVWKKLRRYFPLFESCNSISRQNNIEVPRSCGPITCTEEICAEVELLETGSRNNVVLGPFPSTSCEQRVDKAPQVPSHETSLQEQSSSSIGPRFGMGNHESSAEGCFPQSDTRNEHRSSLRNSILLAFNAKETMSLEASDALHERV